ncbi:hypothetical protein [Nonomuraea sp. NPDC023979]|uniref:hypothetical protein n=1 Tax=Nonomuraea sp. NPDC023979 TaxID=3154796 RepID=UPI0033CE2A5B
MPRARPGELAPGGRWAPPVRWALLDCPDEVRMRRLAARGAPPEWTAGAMADAAQGRSLATTVFTGDGDLADLAARVLAWARDAEPSMPAPGDGEKPHDQTLT